MAEVSYTDEEIESGFRSNMGKMNRKIPGQSLTNDPKQPYPFEQAPQYTTLADALDYYFATLTQEGTYENLMVMISNGVPIMDIVQITLHQGFQEGLFNPDLMMLLIEPMAYMIAAMCEKEGIEFEIMTDEQEEEDTEEQRMPMVRQAARQVTNLDKPDVLPEQIQERVSLLAPQGEQ